MAGQNEWLDNVADDDDDDSIMLSIWSTFIMKHAVLQTSWNLQGYITLHEYHVNGIVHAWMCYENVCIWI